MKCWLAALFALALCIALCFTTAGAGIRFADVATQSGISARMRCGSPEKRWIPEANGSGAAWLDYDNDGLMDLFIVNGSTIDDLREIVAGRVPPARSGSLYLYRNLGNGRFEDVTAKAGLANRYWGTGANAVDFDNDGYTDILVTNIGVDLLFRNNGNGTFTEVGRAAGLSQKVAWHTGSAFGDFDNDGRPDLFVAGYVDPTVFTWQGDAPVCNYRGLPGFCGPQGLKGETDILYHNEGNGRFTDVTEKAGVTDRGRYHGFTVVFDDFNQDGKMDIFVANDSDSNYLYLNQGNGRFREAGLVSGVAYSADGRTQSNMGVAVGDFDNNGRLDLLTTTFSEDYFPLFRQEERGLFEDVSARLGLRTVTVPWVGWACGFADFDNDGRTDLWIANGHVYPNADLLGSTTYLQPIAVFENAESGFALVPDATGALPRASWRGGCTGDFNNDGRMDLVVLPISGSPLLLENRSQTGHSWIGFRLQGTHSNRDAIGAKIWVDSCGKTQFETMRNGGSYLSHNDPRLHFGLGACRSVDRVRVQWPDGANQVLNDPAVNRYHTVREP
jgi:hypothetical protein